MKKTIAIIVGVFALGACTPAQINEAIRIDHAARGEKHTWGCRNAEGQRYGFYGYDRDVPAGCVRVPATWVPQP